MDRVEEGRTPLGEIAAPAIGGLGLLAAVLALDHVLGDRSPLFERPPAWSPIYVLRTVLVAAGSFLIVAHGRRLVSALLPDREHDVGGGVTATAVIGAATAGGAAVLVALDPAALSSLVVEDGPIEWLSALLAFAAALLIAVSIGRFVRVGSMSRRALLAAAGVGGLSLLIGLEEISWFQRVLDFESPDGFRAGDQSEFNLHNQATSLSENLYYLGAFVGLVVVPALIGDRPLRRRWSDLEVVVPGRAAMYGSIMGAAIAYEMWEIVPIQLAFFASLALVVSGGATFRGRLIGPPVAAVMVVVSLAFLAFGDQMIRSWDDTEVRELFPPLGLLVYGWQLHRRSRRTPS